MDEIPESIKPLLNEVIKENARRTDDEVHKLDGIEPEALDQLDGIFELQAKFMELMGIPSLDVKGRDNKIPVSDFMKMLTVFSQTCTTAINCETTELLDALPWKPWKKVHVDVDVNNVHIEIVDLAHFVVELALIWGLDSKTFFDLYRKKMQENIDRQSKGY